MKARAYRRFPAALLLLAFAGCVSDSRDGTPDGPYAGLTCEAMLATMQKEIAANSGDDSLHSAVTVRGYPPVVGVVADSAYLIMADTTGPLQVIDPESGLMIPWIPPYGYGADSFVDSLPPDSLLSHSPESTSIGSLPANVAAVQIFSAGAYSSQVRIFDYGNRLISEFRQSFGYHGELSNPNRAAFGGRWVSFLVWNGKDARGLSVKSGVYRWDIILTSPASATEKRSVKTGWVDAGCSGM